MQDTTTFPDFRALQRRTIEASRIVKRSVDVLGKDFSLTALIQSMAPNCGHPDQRSLEASHQISRIATEQSGGNTPMGAWVPFEVLQTRDIDLTSGSVLKTGAVAKDISLPMAASASLLTEGATLLTGLSGGSVGLPTFATGPDLDTAGVWTADLGTVQQREPTFAQRVLQPKALAFTLTISRRLLLQTSTSIEMELRRLVLQAALNGILKAVLNGSAANEPLGLLNDGGLEVLSAGTNGAAPTWAHLAELESAVTNRTETMQRPGWLLPPLLRKKLRTTARGTNLDVIMPGTTLLDVPAYVTKQLPTNLTKGTGTALTPLVFGDLAELVVGFWGPAGVDLLVDGVTRANQGQVRIIARVEVGYIARTIGAFSAYKDLNPA